MAKAGAFVIVFLAGIGMGYLLGLVSIPVKVPVPPALDLSVSDGGIYRVRKVVDGDTVMLENGLHVRYHGINTPEMGRFVRDQAPLAAEATARNIALAEGKRVRLRLAPDPLDMHGRVVAHVHVLSENDSSEIDARGVLLQEGLARPMGLGVSAEEYQELKKFEQQAREARRGLWGLEDKLRGADGLGKPYCGSSNSTLFHLTTCAVAKRIRPENLHLYASLDDVEAAGLKACARCVPK